MRVTEGEERAKGVNNVFDDFIAENFLNVGMETDIQV